MLWPDTKLMYDFYEVMNSTNKHDKSSGEAEEICHEDYMEKTDTDMGYDASFHLSMTVRKYINTQKDWLTNHNSSSKEGSILKSK